MIKKELIKSCKICKSKKIKFLVEKKHVFGSNKLLPFSIIIWKKAN